MTGKTYEALVRARGTEEWRHVTDNGLNYYADYRSMLVRVQQMATFFPQNEYRIQEVQDA